MAVDTKPNLSSEKFEQYSGEILNLSGCTDIYGEFSVRNGAYFCMSENAGLGKAIISDAYGRGTWQDLPSGVSGENITKEITQTSHGFAIGNVIGWSGGTYNKAIANGTYDGEVIGVVVESGSSNTFKVTQAGYITGLTGLVTNTTYFLSDTTAGLMTATEPTTDGYISRAVLIANSTTSGWVLPYPGYIITTGGTGSIATADNGLNLNGSSIELGGTLCKNTDIALTGNSFTISGVNAALSLDDAHGNCSAMLCGSGATLYLNGCAAMWSDYNDVFKMCPTCTIFCSATGGGIKYNDNYSGSFTNRSLVDKEYVNNAIWVSGGTAGAITGATNLGSGNGTIYTSVSGCKLQLKTLSGGTNVTLTCNANYIAINAGASGIGWSHLASGSTVAGCGTCASGTTRFNTLYGVYAGSGITTTATGNVGIGICALRNNKGAGVYNVAIGHAAMPNNCGGGSYNTAIGINALFCNTGSSASHNIAIGCAALYCNRTGNNNVAIGQCSLSSNCTGIYNIALGWNSLHDNRNGQSNFAAGQAALYCNVGGGSNIAIGYQSLLFNTSGNYNLALGNQALFNGCTGCDNIAIGQCSQYRNCSVNDNIGIGKWTLYNTSGNTANNNIAIGSEALYNNRTAANNIAIGYQALLSNINSGNNLAIGTCAIYCGNGGQNIGIGNYALQCTKVSSGNIAIGIYALRCNSGGTGNIGIGGNALCKNISGSNNIVLGYGLSTCNISGSDNVSIGSYNMANNRVGNFNVGIGSQVLQGNTSGNTNVAIGYSIMGANCLGCNNIAIGSTILGSNLTGKCNIAIGVAVMTSNTSGCANIAIGNGALGSNLTGTRNVAIGDYAGYNETSSNKLHIANCLSCTLIYGDFVNKCVQINNQLKVSGYTYLLTAPINGTCSNSALVWDSATCLVKKVPYFSGLTVSQFTTYTGETQTINNCVCDPTGFVNNQNIVVRYNTGRTITLSATSGNVEYLWNGVRKSLGSSWTSSAHTNDTTAWYLYSTDGTNFSWSNTVWNFNNLMVAARPANTTWAIREIHGTMQNTVHAELHKNFGTYRDSGFGFTAGTYRLQPTPPSGNTDNTPGFESGVIKDEDIATSLPAWTKGTYTQMYFTGASSHVITTGNTALFRVGTTYPKYNPFNGTTFTETEMASGDYANWYVVRIPVTADAVSQQYRAVVLQPQFTYTTCAAAQAESPQNLYLGNLSAIFNEFVLVERITLHTLNSYSAVTGNVRIEALAVLTGTRYSQVSTTVGLNAVTAGNVSVVPVSPFTQTNMQTLSDAYAACFASMGVSGSGQRISKEIYQLSHGFVAKDVIGWSGGTYNKAIADGTYDGEIIGIISKCLSADCFELTQAGYVTGLTSLSTNTTYFLSPTTAGLLTATKPTTTGQIVKAALIADSTTSGWVLPYPGYLISVSSGSTGGSSLSEYTITGDSVNVGFVINHGKNKQFVMIQVAQAASPYATVYTDVQRPNANCICVIFDDAPPTGTCYKIMLIN